MKNSFKLALLLLVLGWLAATDGTGSKAATPVPVPAPARIVAMGDLHGDVDAARAALRLAGAIDENDRWIGGKLVLVQTGDQIDRGDKDREVLDLLTRLADEAALAGGAVYSLNGNHELMNAALDFRYATPASLADFADFDTVATDTVLAALPEAQRGRAVAFRPGGPYALVLARRNVVIIVGDNLFVHGGVLPAHVDYGIERINEQVQAWLQGDAQCPEWIHSDSSPTWDRSYSDQADADDCETLRNVLETLDVKRMIVGHTVQEDGITSFCDGRVWRIDTGMSAHYGGTVQVLEIKGDSIRILAPQ